MKAPLLTIVFAATGFLAGFSAMRWVPSAQAVKPPESPRHEAASTIRERPDGDASTAKKSETTSGKHDFASMLRRSRTIFARFSKLLPELERMETSALKSLALELSTTTMEGMDMKDRQAVFSVTSAASAEIYRREGLKALEWASGIEPKEKQRAVLSGILNCVAKDTPDTAKTWIDRYRSEFGDEWARQFVHHAIIGANGRGADDVIHVQKLFGDDLRGVAISQGTYAEDFDFHRLVTGMPSGFPLDQAVEYWAARDKDEAWKGVLEVIFSQNQGAAYLGSLFRGMSKLEGEEPAAKWTVEKLDQIPSGLRERAILSLGRYPLQKETIATMSKALTRDEDRLLFVSAFVSPFRAEMAVGALKTLDSEALKVQALLRSATPYSRKALDPNKPADKVTLDFFASMMNQLNLSPTSREQVETALRH